MGFGALASVTPVTSSGRHRDNVSPGVVGQLRSGIN